MGRWAGWAAVAVGGLLALVLGRMTGGSPNPLNHLGYLERDVETGLQSAVDGMPSLFIDGRRYRGPRSLGRALGPATD